MTPNRTSPALMRLCHRMRHGLQKKPSCHDTCISPAISMGPWVRNHINSAAPVNHRGNAQQQGFRGMGPISARTALKVGAAPTVGLSEARGVSVSVFSFRQRLQS